VAKGEGFLNVDLEIGARSRARLLPIIEQVADQLFEMYIGRIRGLYCACYELIGPNGRRYNPSAVIHGLADVIEGLNASGRRAWNAASKRDFNIGVELNRGISMTEHTVDDDAVRRVAALKGRIVFTLYQPAAMKRVARRRM
jgi:hypothetical protein